MHSPTRQIQNNALLFPSHFQKKPSRWLSRYLFILTLFFTAITCLSCTESPEEIYQQLDAQAKQYVTDKQYAQAISTWNKLLSLQPDAPNIYFNLAKSYQLNTQYLEAIHAFQEYLVQHPNSYETLINIIKIQLLLFDISGARKSWEKLKTFRATPETLIIHGDILATMEQYISAIEEYKKALTLAPGNQFALARLAIILLGQNKIKNAESYYRTLEEQHPASADILLQMGNYWILTGDRKKADHFLHKAIEQAPTDPTLQVKLAELYLDSGQFSKAARIFKQLLNNAPHERFYKKMLFESLLQDKQFLKLEPLIMALTTAENQDVEFLLLKGKFYLNTGKYFVAASQLELALEKEPRLPLAHYLLALTYLASGQNNLGHKRLVKSLMLSPYFTDAELTLVDFYYKTREYDLALQHVIRIQRREPENPRSYLLQGNILLAQKQYDAARTAFQKAYTLAPTMLEPMYYAAVLSSFTNKPDQALALFQNLISRKPLAADAILLYTRLLSQTGHPDKALHYIMDLISAHPESPYLHYISGLIFLSTKKNGDAVNAFNTALNIAPDMKECYLQLFNIYQNDYNKLHTIILKAINNINNFEEAQIRLAALYNTNQQPKKAIALLQKALSSNPDSPVLANNLACLYLEHQPNNIDEAMRLASLAYDKRTDNAAIADTLGWIYFQKKLPIRAGWLLEEACNLGQDNPVILYHLAVVQLELNKKKLALENLIKAKKLSNDPQLQQKIEKRLQSIPK